VSVDLSRVQWDSERESGVIEEEDRIMKKILLIIGIILVIAAVFCFGKGMINRHLYLTVMDGDSAIFQKFRNAFTFYFRLAAGLIIPGIIMLIIWFKIRK